MKKKILLVVTLVVVAAMMFAACGSSETTTLKFTSGGTSGTYYPYCGALGEIWQSNLDNVSVNVQASGATKENIRLISSGEAQVAIGQNDVMSYAYNGTDLFEGEKIENIATLATVFGEVCQVVVRADSDIQTIADLKGKRVSIGDTGSGVEANAKQILAAYGITTADITVQNLGFGDSADAMKNGQIDAFFVTAGPPTTAISELGATVDIRLLEIDDETAAKLIQDYPFYAQYVIPAGTYSGIKTDVKTIAVKATIFVNTDMDEELAYNLTKTLIEKQADLEKANAKGAELSKESAVEGIAVPFHPGAEKYFKEIGVIQ